MTRLFRHDVVESTNDCAFEALAAGRAKDGDLHVARAQRDGRGRLGRRWESPADEGLYLSYVHRPAAGDLEAPADAPAPALLTMAAGLGILDAVRELGLVAARLVWPNDLLVEDAKLAGILVESRGLDPGRPDFVIGIGLNVRQRRFPAALHAERAVTSLALAGLDVDLEGALASVLAHLPGRLAGACSAPLELCEDYAGATGLRGEHVRVEIGRRVVTGRLEGIHPRSGLRIVEDGGERLQLELAHVRALVRTHRSV